MITLSRYIGFTLDNDFKNPEKTFYDFLVYVSIVDSNDKVADVIDRLLRSLYPNREISINYIALEPQQPKNIS